MKLICVWLTPRDKPKTQIWDETELKTRAWRLLLLVMSLFLFTFLPTYFAEPVRPSFVLDPFFSINIPYLSLIKIIPVTSLDIVIPNLALFGFVLLYYLFFDICSQCWHVYFILCSSILNDKNHKKDDWL